MSKLIIGIDIDGVLADFSSAYKRIIEDTIPYLKYPDISDTYPNTWFWEKAGGMSKEDYSKIWKLISTSPDFWLNLSKFPDVDDFAMAIRNLQSKYNDIYFITTRPGRTAKEQTEIWLESYAGFNKPTVLISKEKGLCCKALEITHYIDDKNENSLAVQKDSPKTANFQLIRPWNQAQEGIPRLANIGQFAAILEKESQ